MTFRGLCKARNIWLAAWVMYGMGFPVSGEVSKAQSPWEEPELFMLKVPGSADV